MNQQFSVVRRDNEPFAPEVLGQALRSVPGLTAYDANAIRGDGNGMIGRGFSLEQATALQSGLKAEGIVAEVIEDSLIPALPAGKTIRSVELTDEALLIGDAIGRKTPVPWNRLWFIAAGSVQIATFSKVARQVDEIHIHISAGMPFPVRETKVVKMLNESSDWFLRGELMLDDAKTRYSIEVENFRFVCLGDQLTQDRSANFCLLIRELSRRAPAAALNRGAAAILGEPAAFVYYPRRQSLYEEMTWMLWRAAAGADR